MADLNRLLVDNLAIAFGAVGAVLIVVLLLLVIQTIRLRRAVDAYRALVRGGPGGTLQEILRDHVAEVGRVSQRIEEVDRLHRFLEERSRGSLQHIGLVRFNPFEDTGSDQSFAIALLDDRRDGIVVSSLHGRTNTRIFAKPVENATSSHALSDEEAQAIRIAVKGTKPLPTGD